MKHLNLSDYPNTTVICREDQINIVGGGWLTNLVEGFFVFLGRMAFHIANGI